MGENANSSSRRVTTTSFTRVQTNLRCDHLHLRQMDGILKILQIALGLLAFICVQSSRFSMTEQEKWFNFVSLLGVAVSGILLLCYVFHIVEKCYKIPWIQFQLGFCGVMALCYLIVSILLLRFGIKTAFTVAAVFGFSAMIAYIVDVYMKYVVMKSGDLAQGERRITTTMTSVTVT